MNGSSLIQVLEEGAGLGYPACGPVCIESTTFRPLGRVTHIRFCPCGGSHAPEDSVASLMNGDVALWAAFAFGFALGAAPGPVQLLILSQTARRGLRGGLRVMLGANLTLLAILLALAVGLSAAQPSDTALRVLRVV